MKLLVDMNLSPGWVDRLGRHGFEAVHWSTIGAATAPDVEILRWAKEHQFVVVSNDLDFSAILAAGAIDGPSVVQIRTQDLLSDGVISIVAKALDAHREDIERGALLSIDEGGTRVRMLPLRVRAILAAASLRMPGFPWLRTVELRLTTGARLMTPFTGNGAVRCAA